MSTTRVLLIGDISGTPGMGALFLSLNSLKKKYSADLVVVNGENAASGFGITDEDYYKMKSYGADVVTSGNHIWQKSEIYPLLDSREDLLRPVNYPKGVAGHGFCLVNKGKLKFCVINAQGRTDMPVTDDPFRTTKEIAEKYRKEGYIVIVDFHAESSLEKEALGFYLDGVASVVAGTHTHVQTADEKILPKGTAYITDIGMSGVQGQVIGSNPEISISRQLTQVPYKSEVADGPGELKGIAVTIDDESFRATEIQRF